MARWSFDPVHSNVEFVVRHMMVSKVRGEFSHIDGFLNFDEENPENSSVEATINVNSISTGADDRDNHLRSADFFDAENFPAMTFKSTKIEITGDNQGKITGDLTIRGVSKEVSFDVEYFGQGLSPFGDIRAGFEGTTRINREDFGLTWNQVLESGGVLVSKDVIIEVNLQAVKVTEQAPA
jgi:polyisoprenoid-binding protein YceI